MIRERFRVFVYGDPREGIALRKFAKLYRLVPGDTCRRCKGSGFPGIRPAWAEHAREAGVPPCPNCKGTGRKIEEREVCGGHVELTTNRHGFAHVGFDLGGEEDVLLKLAIPRVFSIWLGLDLGKLGFGWDSRNPLRRLFVRGRPEHAGGEGIRPGPLGYHEREFDLEASRGQVRLKLGVEPMGSSANRLRYRRRYPWEWLREVASTGVLARGGEYGVEPRPPEPTRNRRRWEPPHPVRRRGPDGELVPPTEADMPPDPRSRLERAVYRYLRWRSWLPERGFEVVLLRYDPRDLLLGPHERLEVRQVLENTDAVVAMPEGNYPCKVSLERALWGRKRWPWSHRWLPSADVEMVVPVPSPGKGENSWDCEDDATYGLHGPYGSVAEATAAVASAAMRRRENYGSGARWVPDAGWPEGIAR